MLLLKKSVDLKHVLSKKREKGLSIGFVPTMGALHAGHLSLIEAAKKENPLVVCSIFINPSQFNDPRDFEKYPVTLEKDINLLIDSGCDFLFLPPAEEIYPDNKKKTIHYNLGHLETILEGKYRPGHFQGVCQAVHRLLEIVRPDKLYLGQKDYQQCMVIKKLVELTGLNEIIKIRIYPTRREADGLAMSSRNMRLDAEERKKAGSIFRILNMIKEQLVPGHTRSLVKEAKKFLSEQGFKTDYIEIADAGTLEPVLEWDGKQKLVALAACYINEVRLIDNLLLNESPLNDATNENI